MSHLRLVPPHAISVWTPDDAIATAQAFHDHLDEAERGTRLISQSRWRRARILDAAAVALLMALMAALGVIVFAASAKADGSVSDDVLDYTARYGAGAVCPVLSMPQHHSVPGVMGVLRGVENDGFSEYEAGQVVGLSVAAYCPENQPLLDTFVAIYGSKGSLA